MVTLKIALIATFFTQLICYTSLYAGTDNRSVLPIQDTITNTRMAMTSMEDLELYSLSVFMESALNHPAILIYQTYRDEEKALLDVEKRKWMDYLRIGGSYQYGHNSASVDGTSIMLPTISNVAQSTYSVGVTLSVPIGSLFSNKQRISAQKEVLKRIEYEQEIAIEERKLIILDAYNSVIELWSVLKAKSEAVALYDAQMKISEHDYINGKITIIDLSLERGRRSAAVVTYQEARTALQSAMVLLEMLTDVKISK